MSKAGQKVHDQIVFKPYEIMGPCRNFSFSTAPLLSVSWQYLLIEAQCKGFLRHCFGAFPVADEERGWRQLLMIDFLFLSNTHQTKLSLQESR
jgi:hypothetical protein